MRKGAILLAVVLLTCASVPLEAGERPAAAGDSEVSYEEAFIDLYVTLENRYPCFGLKGIDWREVGDELLPRARAAATDAEFGIVCMELVARLEDSHAQLLTGAAPVPKVDWPSWDPGFACLIDDAGRPVVYHVDRKGPAESAGVRAGMAVVSIDGEDAAEALEGIMAFTRRYVGYSSDRYLRYRAAGGSTPPRWRFLPTR